MNGRIHIAESMTLAAAALLPSMPVRPQVDPLRLQLPPVGFGGGATLPDPRSLRVLSAMYLYAELEEAAIIPVAEVLAANRDTLPIRNDMTMAKLEAFYRKSPEWYDRPHRTTLFARIFGTGTGATNDQGNLVNRDFHRSLAAFCFAITASSGATGWPVSSPVNDGHLAQAAIDLASNLGARQYGNSMVAAREIHEQLMAALGILNDAPLQSTFSAQGLWSLMQAIIGDPSPDFTRLLHRGQDGQRLLDWLASVLPQLTRYPGTIPKIPAGSPVIAWAVEWLDATGLLPNRSGAAA